MRQVSHLPGVLFISVLRIPYVVNSWKHSIMSLILVCLIWSFMEAVSLLSVYSRLFSNTELALVTLSTGTSSETLPVKLFLGSTIGLKKLYVTMYNLGVLHVLNKN